MFGENVWENVWKNVWENVWESVWENVWEWENVEKQLYLEFIVFGRRNNIAKIYEI